MATAGKNGAFIIGTTNVASIKSWKLDVNSDMKETTNFGSNGWKEFLANVKDWSGNVEGDWNVSADTNGQQALQAALLGGTTVSAVFSVDGTHKYTGTAYIKKISVQEQVADVVKFTADIQGTGALSFA